MAIAPFVVAALLGGCDASTKGSGRALDSGGPSRVASGSAGFPSAPSPGSASTSASASPTVSLDLSPCATGRCDVVVRAGARIPLPASMDVGPLAVTAVAGGRLVVTGRVLGNSSGGMCTGQFCDVSSRNGAFTMSLGESSTATENGLQLTVVRIESGTAALRIRPAG